MPKFRSHLIYLAAALGFSRRTTGITYLMLRNKAARCFKLEHVQPDTTIKIMYHAPDLVLHEQQAEGANQKSEDEGKEKQQAQENLESGLDFKYNERRQKRLEMLESSRMKDINIVVVQRYDGKMTDDAEIEAPPQPSSNQKSKRPPTKKIRVQLEQQQGEIFFRTAAYPTSAVEVCVQSYFASQTDPSRIGFNITSSEETLSIEDEGTRARQLTEAEIKAISETNRILRDQSSGITQELAMLEQRIHTMMAGARDNSRVYADFQDQSLVLSKAVRYWPMLRTVVLLIGGYLQMSHVIGYMKRHHVF